MRIIATLLNIALFITALVIFFDEVSNISDWTELLLITLFIITPIASIIALFLSGKSFVATWMKRKTLEEKRKIRDIEKTLNSD